MLNQQGWYTGNYQTGGSQIDFENLSDESIKQHLASRNLSVKGQRHQLIHRLKEEVNKAWSSYYATGPSSIFPGQGGPFAPAPALPDGKKKKKRNPKRKRPPMSEEEKAKLEEELEEKRQAKAAKKEENKRKAEEQREKKRLRRADAEKRQADMEQRQRTQKEDRQKQEVFVYFDMKAFSEQLVKALDKKGTQIETCSYDFGHKGFRVRFSKSEYAAKCARNATMTKPRNLKIPTTCQLLPAPCESNCVFFLDPCHDRHPEKAEALEWVQEQGVESKTSDNKTLNLWKTSALEEYARFGEVVNIYRERGFIVCQFQAASSAKKMFNFVAKGTRLNGIKLLFCRQGTPKKRDAQECDKEFPPPKKVKKKAVAKVEEA